METPSESSIRNIVQYRPIRGILQVYHGISAALNYCGSYVFFLTPATALFAVDRTGIQSTGPGVSQVSQEDTSVVAEPRRCVWCRA